VTAVIVLTSRTKTTTTEQERAAAALRPLPGRASILVADLPDTIQAIRNQQFLDNLARGEPGRTWAILVGYLLGCGAVVVLYSALFEHYRVNIFELAVGGLLAVASVGALVAARLFTAVGQLSRAVWDIEEQLRKKAD
jgi:hypothetical protein